MQERPGTTVNLLEATTRADIAHRIIAGFSAAFPTLAAQWSQVDAALADVTVLAAEVSRLSGALSAVRLDRANLAAATRAAIAAYFDGERDPLSYLRDELHAQGFSVPGRAE